MGDDQRLEPARLTKKAERSPFAPRIPWRWVSLGAGLVLLFAGLVWLRHLREVETLRDQITQVHRQMVQPAAERVNRFRHRIEGWIEKAAKGEPKRWADPRLDLSGLHDAQGLYLRLPRDAADSPEHIAEAARRMNKDAIASCLGLTPISLAGMYGRLDFLSDDWLDPVREADGLMRLRVLDERLARHVKRDLPILLHMLQSDYLLVALQHGDNRRDAPVDVFLWDLHENRLLLSTRTQAEGLLLPVRIRMGGAPRTATRPKLHSGGANDCSIAAQVKAVAGEPVGPALGKKATDHLEPGEAAGWPP